MPQVDWTSPRQARLDCSAANFAHAVTFVFGNGCSCAAEHERLAPADLPGPGSYGLHAAAAAG